MTDEQRKKDEAALNRFKNNLTYEDWDDIENQKIDFVWNASLNHTRSEHAEVMRDALEIINKLRSPPDAWELDEFLEYLHGPVDAFISKHGGDV